MDSKPVENAMVHSRVKIIGEAAEVIIDEQAKIRKAGKSTRNVSHVITKIIIELISYRKRDHEIGAAGIIPLQNDQA